MDENTEKAQQRSTIWWQMRDWAQWMTNGGSMNPILPVCGNQKKLLCTVILGKFSTNQHNLTFPFLTSLQTQHSDLLNPERSTTASVEAKPDHIWPSSRTSRTKVGFSVSSGWQLIVRSLFCGWMVKEARRGIGAAAKLIFTLVWFPFYPLCLRPCFSPPHPVGMPVWSSH